MENKELQAIESTIWEMANRLRGNMDASEYKNYILPLMFYRYLSEKQNRYLVEEGIVEPEDGQSPAYAAMDFLFGTTDLEKVREYSIASKSFTKLYAEKKDKNGNVVYDEKGQTIYIPVGNWAEDYDEFLKDCTSAIGYCISPLYEWTVMKEMVDQSGVRPSDFQAMFDSFNFSLKYNQEAEKKISGIFDDVNLSNTRLGNSTTERAKAISQIIELVSEINYVDETGKDILGSIYEYLIKQFAATAGKKSGEFYTPHEVSSLMSKIVTYGFDKPNTEFTVFDPTCGSGSLLLTVGKELPDGEKPGAVKYFGQELNTSTFNMARMNMMMNNVGYDSFNIRNADTLGSDWPDGLGEDGKFHLRTFDAVVANPPYSQKWEAPESYLKDARFREYGGKLAPKSKADYAFLLDGLYHLNREGTMAIVLPHGVLFRGAAEGVIRKALIEKNLIDAVIGLPANLFYGTSIPTIIMVLKRNKPNKDILFIDASQHFTKSKNKNVLAQEDIERIFDAYKDRHDIERLARVVTKQEIIDNEYNLNIPRYVDTSEEEPEVDLEAVDRQIKEVDIQIEALLKEIDAQLKLLEESD